MVFVDFSILVLSVCLLYNNSVSERAFYIDFNVAENRTLKVRPSCG